MAGVSLKTVSRVVNAEPGVSGKLDSRGRAAIDRLDYRPNLAASNLRRANPKSGTIGVLVKDIANPFFATLLRAVADRALRREVLVIAGSSDGNETLERELFEAFASRRVDGLIVHTSTHDQSHLTGELQRGTAVVFVDRDTAAVDTDSVVTDFRAGIRQGLSHLVARGHRTIGYLGDLQTNAMGADRHQIYRDELSEHRIDMDNRLVTLDLHSIQGGEAAAIRLLSLARPPSALFAMTNQLAIGAHRALRALGLQDRIALVGFDDDLQTDLLHAGVTVIARDAARLGFDAAELLFRRIDGDLSPAVRQVVLPRLIARGSGEVNLDMKSSWERETI